MVNILDVIEIARKEAYKVNSDETIDLNTKDPYYSRSVNNVSLDAKRPANIQQYSNSRNSAKYNKYAKELDELNALYGLPFAFPVNGQDWCTSFVLWVYYRAALKRSSAGNRKDEAIMDAMTCLRLFSNSGQWWKRAYGCTPWVDFIKSTHPESWKSHDDIANGSNVIAAGDIIFMGMGDSQPAHVGIVETPDWSSSDGKIHTIEGNINDYIDESDPNAGTARATISHLKYTRSINTAENIDGYVVGVYHPDFIESVDIRIPQYARYDHTNKTLYWRVMSPTSQINKIVIQHLDGTITTVVSGWAPTGTSYDRQYNLSTYNPLPGDVIKLSTANKYSPSDYGAEVSLTVQIYTTPAGLTFDWWTYTLAWYTRRDETTWRVIKNGQEISTPVYNAMYQDQSVQTGDVFKVYIAGTADAYQSEYAVFTVGPPPSTPKNEDVIKKENIILYDEHETEFNSLGICDLTDAIKCVVNEERNGEYYLEMEYPLNQKGNELQLRRIIFCKPNPYDEPEPFRIYSIKKTHKHTMTLKAYHLSYDLCGWILLPSMEVLTYERFLERINNQVPNSILEGKSTGGGSKYKFRLVSAYTQGAALDKIHRTNIQNNGVDNVRSLICGDEGVIKVYGGELLFRKWNIYHMEKRGKEVPEYTIEYGKNIKSLDATTAVDQSYEGILPYYIAQSKSTVSGQESPPEFKTMSRIPPVVPVRNGVSVDAIDYSRILLYDITNANFKQEEYVDDYPTDEGFERITREYINENGLLNKLDVGTCDFTIELDNSILNGQIRKSYAGVENVRLCDNVYVHYPEIGITATKKITKTVYDAIRNYYTKLEVTDGTEESNKIGSILSNNFTSGGTSSTITYADVLTLIEKNKGGNLTVGYRKLEDNVFYTSPSYTIQCEKKENTLYLDIPTGYLFTYQLGETGYRPCTGQLDTQDYATKDWVIQKNYVKNEEFDNSPDFDFDSGDSGWWIIKASKWATRDWVAGRFDTENDFIVNSTTKEVSLKNRILTPSETNSILLSAYSEITGYYWTEGSLHSFFYYPEEGQATAIYDFYRDGNMLYINDTRWALKSWVKSYFSTGDFIENQNAITIRSDIWASRQFTSTTYAAIADLERGGDFYYDDDSSEWHIESDPVLNIVKTYLPAPTAANQILVSNASGASRWWELQSKTNFLSGTITMDKFSNDFYTAESDEKIHLNVDDLFQIGLTSDFTQSGSRLLINPNKWALKSWVQDNFVQKCLKAGSKIKMADGTEKNVEDVVPGDVVLSYDIANDTTCDAVVLNMRQTGMAEAYTAMVFDNETYVELYGEHDIYMDDRQCLECYQFMDTGENAITTTGEKTKFVFRQTLNHHKKIRHYALVTSNHLYFANGILMGTRPDVTYEYACEVDIPEELSSMLHTWAEYGKSSAESLLSPEHLHNIIQLSKQQFDARVKMEALGSNLRATDYVPIKSAEANIDNSSEEIDMNKITQRRAWRAEVRIREQEYAAATEAIEAYKTEHGIENGLSNKDKLLYANTQGNLNLNLFKSWAQSK